MYYLIFIMCILTYLILVLIIFLCYSFYRVIVVRKFFLLGFVFLLCGCGAVREPVDDFNSTKYGLAKNSVSAYVNCVKLAYAEYQYGSLTGTYEVREGSTPVNVDGVFIDLNVVCYGDEVKCESVSVISGRVILDDCSIYGYNFSYDGQVIDK